MTFGYILKIVFVLLVITFIQRTYDTIQSTPTIKKFDPYELLGITPAATDKEIKKAYR